MLRWLRSASVTATAGKLDLSVMSAAFIIFGLSLAFQPRRWETTPAYHVLLLIFQPQVWGILFLLSGAAMGLAAWGFARWRWLVISALTAAFTLTTGWACAFVARYVSSPNTTPETWVSWAIFDFLLIKVAISLDRAPPSPLPPPERMSQEISDYRQAVDDALTGAAADQKVTLWRVLDTESEKLRDAVSAASAAYAQALHAIIPAGGMPGGDPAKQALDEARNALKRAEEAYARATGRAAQDSP